MIATEQFSLIDFLNSKGVMKPNLTVSPVSLQEKVYEHEHALNVREVKTC